MRPKPRVQKSTSRLKAVLLMLIPLVVAFALFMENLDSTVVATALPSIARDLAVDPVALKLAFTSYILSIAVFTPISGWCADRFGSRTVFRTAIIVFLAGSILCALTSTLWGFVLSRIVQGMGGAMMTPVGRLILFKTVDKKDFVRALSWLTVPALVGPVLGPPVGGFITTYLEWRWIFWINVPIGLVGLVAVQLFIKQMYEENVPPLDLVGFALSGVGLAGFVFGIAASGIGILPHALTYSLIAVGLFSLGLYIWHSRRVEHPVVDLSIFKIVTLRTAILTGFLFRIGLGAAPFLLPLMLQVGFGYSAFASGTLTFLSTVGALLMKITAPPIIRRFGFRDILIFNAFVSALFLALNGVFTATTPWIVIASVLLIGGYFRSLQFTAINALAYSDIPAHRMSHATSLTSVLQQISVACGVAVAAGVLETVRSGRADHDLIPSDFSTAFFIVAGISCVASLAPLALGRNAGSEVSGHRVEEPA